MVMLRRRWPLLLLGLGVLLVLLGAIALRPGARGPAAGHPGPPRAVPSTQAIISDYPSPSPVADVAPPDGMRIRLPELGVDLPVVTGDGYNAPLYKAATYPGLKLPGQGGRSIIYAHAQAGMFAPLFNAHTGQEISVAYPDGRNLKYRIRVYNSRWPITDTSVLQPKDGEELVLITCTTYNYNDPRIVVIAEPV